MDGDGLTSSFGSTYSSATMDYEQSVGLSETTVEGLKESAPLLFKGTSFTDSPSPFQSWKAVIAELRGPQRMWAVLASALVASLSAILAGFTLGYPSKSMIELGLIQSFNSTLLLDLFGALAPFGAIFGGGMAGWSSETLGRHPTLLLSCLPNIIGWLLLSCGKYIVTPNIFKSVVLTGRFFTGFAMGWSMLSAPMYIAEISPPLLRGLFSAVPQLGLAIGILLVYCVEAFPHSDFAYTALVAVFITFLFAIMAVWLLETPRYLVKNGDLEKASIHLKKLRGPYIDIQIELDDIKNVLHNETTVSIVEFISELRKRSIYIPLILLLFILSFQQLSGINALIFYAAQIINQSHISNTQFTALLAIGITEVITTCLTVFIIDLFGRKILLLLSCIVMCISCIGLGSHLFVVSQLPNNIACTSSPQCNHTLPLAVTSVIMVIFGFSLGLGAIPWTLVTEIVPLRVRGLVGGIVSAVNWLFAAIVTGTYSHFGKTAGNYTAWWIFGGLNLFAAFFVSIFLPETKGKKLEEIEKQIQTRYQLCSWK